MSRCHPSCRRRLPRLLAPVALIACAHATAARAQQPPPSDEFTHGLATITLAQSLDADPALALPVEATNDELLRRLMATEQRLAEVEAQLQSAQPASPGDSVAPVEIPEAPSFAEEDAEVQEEEPAEEEPEELKWYDKYTVRGYAQFRWNDVMDLEPGSAPPQHVGDRSVGDDQEFLIRRARLIFAGDISEHLYCYLQPDFAVTPPGSPDANHFVQIRDWYGDWYLTPDKIHRLRVGQSKVPYGWENMQSSSNRLPLDRNDGLNSAVRNERDLGIFYYWTPESDQEIFTWVNDQGLKGSGNYGTFGFGAYNGQGGSLQEQNDRLHIVSRFTYPFFLDNGQLMELSMQGYLGDYVVLSTPISPLGVGAPARPAGTLETGDSVGHRDERLAWTAVVYPQPLGFQAEWNVGRGPALNDAQTAVVDRPLYGGYAQVFYRLQTACYGEFWPFARYNRFKGGYKAERNAPFCEIEEWECGVEWQINKQVELVGMFTFTDRTNTTAVNAADELSYRQFVGDLFRTQIQINY